MKKKIHKDMLVGDIVALLPSSSEIITNYGLHCIGCHYNAFETLEQGLLGHGYSEEDLKNLVRDLNEHAEKTFKSSKAPPKTADRMKIMLTKKALQKVNEIQKSEGKEGQTLRVEVTSVQGAFKYSMNFIAPSELSTFEKVFHFDDLQVCVNKYDYKKLNNLEIDYVEKDDRSGFKMNNPNKLS